MPAMRLFPCFLQLLAGLALPAVPPQQWALSPGNGSSEVEVVPFQEVWGRSYCRALERLVDIVSEYPSEVEHMFSPSCVSLLRCTGCCGDENLHCVPVETVNVTMQASAGEDEARKVRRCCSPEVTSPLEERDPTSPARVFITVTLSVTPAGTCPLFISQLFPC
ncbi:placenta growth factor isoform X8 [Macaca fascicularis]|uniref:placenta growth factor isoform X8 n=1 Tax=Macaca fascicularis TaxID=9541 RepID=UPI0032B040C1